MTDLDDDALSGLLDDLRRELTVANEELERSRDAHRRVETMLLAVLEHVPLPLVVVDVEQRVRAVSAAAEVAWDARLDAPVGGVAGLREGRVDELARAVADTGALDPGAVPDGFGAALVEEPGTAARYLVVWSSSSCSTDASVDTGQPPTRGSTPKTR